MAIKAEFVEIANAELVDASCEYPGSEDIPEGQIAIVAGDGGVNVYLVGTPQQVTGKLLRLAAQAAKYVTVGGAATKITGEE